MSKLLSIIYIGILWPLELLYQVAFFLIIAYKKLHTKQNIYPFTIISVGNLSVGGTGKSVVVSFLIEALGINSSAIVLRGYGAQRQQRSPCLVSDGNKIFVTSNVAGDEAIMHAERYLVPVITCVDRSLASKFIYDFFICKKNKPIDWVIFDDAYQHVSIVKNIEILLIDARNPFDNGHCLPVGKLREKNFRRAHIIIITHADMVNAVILENIKQKQLVSFPKEKIFTGRHAFNGFYRLNSMPISPDFFSTQHVLALAGIGSFSGFIETIKQVGVTVDFTRKYSDHYRYTKHDAMWIISVTLLQKKTAIITTEKDWVKLRPLLLSIKNYHTVPIFVMRISFEFLSLDQYPSFIQCLQQYKVE